MRIERVILSKWRENIFNVWVKITFAAVKTAGMKPEALEKHIEFKGIDLFEKPANSASPAEWKNGWIIAIGHFGNFELYARSLSSLNGRVGAATYRGLNQPGLNRLLQELRASSGVRFFDRRKEVGALRKLMTDGSVVLGLLADQVAGSGIFLDFLGEKCLCSTAPAIFSKALSLSVGNGGLLPHWTRKMGG
jgi:lauroyl/myristoyl acyltransferase